MTARPEGPRRPIPIDPSLDVARAHDQGFGIVEPVRIMRNLHIGWAIVFLGIAAMVLAMSVAPGFALLGAATPMHVMHEWAIEKPGGSAVRMAVSFLCAYHLTRDGAGMRTGAVVLGCTEANDVVLIRVASNAERLSDFKK